MNTPRKPRLTIKSDGYTYKFITPFKISITDPENKKWLFEDIFFRNFKLYKNDKDGLRMYLKIRIKLQDNRYINYVLRYKKYLTELGSNAYAEQMKISEYFIRSNIRIKIK